MVTRVARRPNAELLQRVPYTDDPVEFTLRCVAALAPLPESVARAAEEHVRHFFGESAESRARAFEARNEQIRRLHQHGERPGFIARRYGLSRSQVHRILGSGSE